MSKDDVIERRYAIVRHSEAYDGAVALSIQALRFGGRQAEAVAVVAYRISAGGFLFTPDSIEALGRAIAAISVSRFDQVVSYLVVEREPLGLYVGSYGAADVWSLVPVQTHPPKRVEHSLDSAFGAATLVGIFHTDHERTAMPSREQPGEDRSPDISDVRIASWARGESYSYLLSHVYRISWSSPSPETAPYAGILAPMTGRLTTGTAYL
jgi:hypothetical protein